MKTSNWIILAVVLGILAMAGTAQATVYNDAISINVGTANPQTGTESTPYYGATSWLNYNYGNGNSDQGVAFTNVGVTSAGQGTQANVGAENVQNPGSGVVGLTGWAIWNGNSADALYWNVSAPTGTWISGGYDVAVQGCWSSGNGGPATWNLYDNGGADYSSSSPFTQISMGSGYGGNVTAIQFLAIPEPATMALLAMGGLALLRRKRR